MKLSSQKQNRKIHPFFSKLEVNPAYLCSEGNKDFSKKVPKIKYRGGWPYYRPFFAKRYGLDVSNMPTKADDQLWLGSKSIKGQWAIAYHALSVPNQPSPKYKNMNLLQQILSQLKTGQCLKYAQSQFYEYSECINKPKQNIGKGIICTPHIQQAIKQLKTGIKIDNQCYYMIFQCRVNPSAIKITNQDNIWVINQVYNIRPYAIIIIDQNNKKNIKDPLISYKEIFTWAKYKQAILSGKYLLKQNIQQIQVQKIIQDLNKSKSILDQIDKIFEKSQTLATKVCQSILNVPIKSKQLNKSIQMQKLLKKQIAKKQDPLSIILLNLKKQAQSQNSKLFFSQKSNLQTKLSTKIFSTGFMAEKVMFLQSIKEYILWNYQELKNNQKVYEKFISYYKQGLCKDFSIKKDEIVIHNIYKGSIMVEWSCNCQQKILSNKQNFQIVSKKRGLTLHPFFKFFKLSPQDFSIQGNIDFSNYGGILYRGGWPYFQPSRGKRYGIKVKEQYDLQLGYNCDRWLRMSGEKGEWAVAFHGTVPDNRYKNVAGQEKYVLESIMQGRQKGQMLRKGWGQVHQHNFAKNKSNKEKVGQGIYCSPHLFSTLAYCGRGLEIERLDKKTGKIQKVKYYLIFQCRVNPSAIKVTQVDQYWVINQSKDIRPYGIILLTEQERKNYQWPFIEYKNKHFKWDTYKDIIQINLQKNRG